jgi:hypothetical protein
MPQADGPSGATKETPQQLTEEMLEQVDKHLPEQDDIRGGGAHDRFSNREPDEIVAGDTDAHGIKPPDAMGAGG